MFLYCTESQSQQLCVDGGIEDINLLQEKTTSITHRNINVYWHFVYNDDGTVGPNEFDFQFRLQTIRDVFLEHGIWINTRCDLPTGDDISIGGKNWNYIYDSNLSGTTNSDYPTCAFNDYCFNDGLNVFLLAPSESGPRGAATIGGNIVFSQYASVSDVETIVHEIGHAFGLFHS